MRPSDHVPGLDTVIGVSQIPWWSLLLVAVVFGVAGAATALFVTRPSRKWYTERKNAYVDLLAIFERDTVRLRAAFDAGDKPVQPSDYFDEVSPALMRVRLLATGPVRSAALAVHLLLQQLHGQMNPAGVSGVRPETHFRELLAQVPLVMQQFEAAVREELGIETEPPVASLNGDLRAHARQMRRGERAAREVPEKDETKI